METPRDVFTREQRREVCIHEASHAVVFSLGGAFVYDLAVAPEGAMGGEWKPVGRKGGRLHDVWGYCSPSDNPATFFLRWDAEECVFQVDRRAWKQQQSNIGRTARSETIRQLRAHVCGLLAGCVADQIQRGDDFDLWLEPEGDGYSPEDCHKAEATCWLLPFNELSFLIEETHRVLQMPEIWERVLNLADALEMAGSFSDDVEIPFLPERLTGWPKGPRHKRLRIEKLTEPA